MAVIAASPDCIPASARSRWRYAAIGAGFLALFLIVGLLWAYAWTTGDVLSVGAFRLLGPHCRQPYVVVQGPAGGARAVTVISVSSLPRAGGRLMLPKLPPRGKIPPGSKVPRVPIILGPIPRPILVKPQRFTGFSTTYAQVPVITGRLIWQGGGFTLVGPL